MIVFPTAFIKSNSSTSNLVLHFDPNNTSSYPGSGTTIYDLSGNNLTGTLSNITYTSPAFNFNGTSSQISVADNALLEPGSGDWTMEVWVNQSVAGNDVVLGKFDPGGLSQDVSYSIRTTSSTYYAQIGSGSGSGSTLYINSSNHSGSINTWYQIVYVFTNIAANTLQTFVNGSSIGSVSHSLASILNTSANLYIGSYNNGEYAQWFDGKIGAIKIYNKALSESEVVQNYLTNASTYGLSADAIRVQLSAAEQTTYDAATVGNWIKVAKASYDKVAASVTGATKKGNSDAQINTRDVLTSVTYPVTFGSGSTASFQINSGEYVIAMITEAWNASGGNSQLGYTTTFKGSSITNIGGTAGPSVGGGRDYYVRKAPTDVATETRYPTLSMTVTPNAVSSWSGFYTANSGTSWTSLPAGQTSKIQIITTSTKSW